MLVRDLDSNAPTINNFSSTFVMLTLSIAQSGRREPATSELGIQATSAQSMDVRGMRGQYDCVRTRDVILFYLAPDDWRRKKMFWF